MSTQNAGARWTEEMDRQLVEALKAGKGLEEVADICGRTTGAIIARMEFLGAQMVRFAQLKKLIVENL